VSRTLTAPMQSHLATRAHSLCDMLLIQLRDGDMFGITDHDRDIEYNLDSLGLVTYDSGKGILPSDVALSCGLDANNCEISGPITEDYPFTRTGIVGGRFDRAKVWYFRLNWQSPSTGLVRIMAGNVAEARAEGGKFVLSIRDAFDRYNQTLLRLMTPYCEADHETCCVNIAPETATTVTAVASAYEFTVAATLTDNHVPGRFWFTSGNLVGCPPMEIHDRSGNTIIGFAGLVEAPQVGDAMIVKEGCNRTREQCRDRFDNILEFRGYPEVGGSDQALRFPVPGTGGNV
jgi:uncharacterized phage protein (TIGR02218 family)